MAGCILDYSVGVVTNAPIVKQFYRELRRVNRGCASTSPITALSNNWANDVHPPSILRPLQIRTRNLTGWTVIESFPRENLTKEIGSL